MFGTALALAMPEIKQGRRSTITRLWRRTSDLARERSLGYAFNRVTWKLYHSRFERRKRGGIAHAAPEPMIRYLGQKFQLHSSPHGLGEELLLYGIHEPLGTEFYLQYLSPGDHVLDIGSNIGYWLLMAEQAIGKFGRILGFEPAPDVYSILQENIVRSGHTNVQVFPYAIGGTNEIGRFYQSEVSNWSSLIQQKNLRQTSTIDVQVRRLSDVLNEFPDFHPSALRMDLEGAELTILETAHDILARYKPCLFVEFHPQILSWPSIRNTLVTLRDIGYSSGTLIERTWDQPWISKWMRRRRSWIGSIETLMQRIENPRDPISDSTFSLILARVVDDRKPRRLLNIK